MKKRNAILIGAIVAALGTGAVGVGTSLAAQGSVRQPEFMSELVDAVALEFSLDPEAVREVFHEQLAEHREEMQASHAERFEQFLVKAVADGKITEAEADAVREKRAEMAAYMESLEGMDPGERHEAMQEKMEEVRDWAEENGIPMEYVRFGAGGKMGPAGAGHRGVHPNR